VRPTSASSASGEKSVRTGGASLRTRHRATLCDAPEVPRIARAPAIQVVSKITQCG